MASSSFRISVSNQRNQEFPIFACPRGGPQNPGKALLLMVAAFSSFAIAFAPEAPLQQASICQRHNSSEACLVW